MGKHETTRYSSSYAHQVFHFVIFRPEIERVFTTTGSGSKAVYPTNHGRLTSLVDGSLQSIGGSPGSPCFDLPNVGTETFLCEQVRFGRLVGCRLDHGSSWRRFDLPHTTKSTTLTLRTLPKEAKKEGQSEWVRSEIHSTKIGLERLEVKHLKI